MNGKKKIILGVSSFLVLSGLSLCILASKVEPITIKQPLFTFDLHDPIPTNLDNYIQASDSVLEETVLNIKNVEVGKVGKYNVEVVYKDKVYPFKIQIRDKIAPVASLIKVKWEIKIGDTLNARDMIASVEEDSSYEVYFDEENKPATMTFNKAGTFNNMYIVVEDEYGNISDRLRVSISVGKDQIPPTIHGCNDCSIYLGSNFNPLKGISASDDIDGNITNKIKVEGKVDVNKEGTYSLKYSVRDSNGNETKIIRNVTVTKDYIPSFTDVPDVASGIYLTKEQAKEREIHFINIKKARLTADTKDANLERLINYLTYSTKIVDSTNALYTSSYSVIVDGVGNHEGMSRAVKYMCDQLEIECYFVEGKKDSKNHTWNIVKYNDEYYHIDLSLNQHEENQMFSDTQMKQLGYHFSTDLPACNAKGKKL